MILHALLYFALGLFAATLGSMVGIGGGGSIISPVLLLLGVSVQDVISLSVFSMLGMSASSAAAYIPRRQVNIPLALAISALAIPAGLVGRVVSFKTNDTAVQLILAAFLGFAAVRTAWRSFEKNKPEVECEVSDTKKIWCSAPLTGEGGEGEIKYYTPHAPWAGVLFGAPLGFFTGMVGFGGGSFYVPIMHLINKIPMRQTVATSAMIIGLAMIAPTIVSISRGVMDWQIGIPLLVGVLAGGQLGPILGEKVDANWLRIIFGIALLAATVQIIINAFK